MENPYRTPADGSPHVGRSSGSNPKSKRWRYIAWSLIGMGSILEGIATYDFARNSYRGSPNPWLLLAFWLVPVACLSFSTTLRREFQWNRAKPWRWIAFSLLLTLAAWICFGVTCFAGTFASLFVAGSGIGENLGFALSSVVSLLGWCYITASVAGKWLHGR